MINLYTYVGMLLEYYYLLFVRLAMYLENSSSQLLNHTIKTCPTVVQ